MPTGFLQNLDGCTAISLISDLTNIVNMLNCMCN